MTASFSLFNGIEAMGIFSIFSKMTQQSIDRMNAIKDVPEMQDLSGTELLTGTKPDAFTIHFNHVHFAYNEKEVLHDISFSIPEKTTTALVGLSGSGKTTIINLLARFWDIHTGSITIGGADIKKIKYENLLHNINFVFQDVFLFNDTIIGEAGMRLSGGEKQWFIFSRLNSAAEKHFKFAYRKLVNYLPFFRVLAKRHNSPAFRN